VRGNKRELEVLQGRLVEAERRVAELEGELRACRTRDTLTGLSLLDPVMRRLGPEIERCKRHSRPLTMVVIDIDDMRSINVHHGREVGDRVLVEVAATLCKHVRSSDSVSRSGPDEFAILMPETDTSGALQALERIMLELEALKVERVESVSVSAGVAEWLRPLTGEQLLQLAGSRAHAARAIGGGRVQYGDPPAAADGDGAGSGKGDVVAALAEALTERDRYTGEHSESVVALVERVARGLALSDAEVDTVKAAALLHDIGKVAIPDDVLNKPGPLDEDEWRIMREHPVIGERILRAIPGMGSIARIVRHEHERFDGGGYPDGLVGDEIPIGARVILACDAYHAMTSDRPYRRSMGHAEAIRELASGAGTQFDPAVTEVLIGCLYGRREPAAGGPEGAPAPAAA
jgi:diguanylate cyclase (GGDEF)-like protein/putative nucleotidyltransferase with HDIG domain